MSAAMPLADVAVSPGPPDQKEAVRRQIPSQRTREVFAAVAMGKSHAEVADQFGLTQPRVTQIVRQVREWSMQVAGGELGKFNEAQRLRLAEETLRVQLDGWMRMAMQEWRKSCREGIGRVTYLNAAGRLSANLAKLAGVDVSGKTARLLAEQQAKAEYELRRARAAEKPLWENEPQARTSAPATEKVTAPTLSAATVCDKQSAQRAVQSQPTAPIKNSYGLAHPEVALDVAKAMKDRLTHSTPPASVPCADKPIPKFLDKKVRKRLLALRRQEALAAVG
ncbi:MAG: hypothetical protein K8R36_09940 [Planctomycetales bacterium]|nr:hypothetical protein [Planctomycetales bacterium]